MSDHDARPTPAGEAAAPGRRRVVDGLVGAGVAVLVLLVVAGGLLWWVSEPAADGADRATSNGGTPDGATTDGVGPGPEPPGDLAPGETWLGDVTLDAGAVATPDTRLTDVSAVGTDVRAGTAGLTAGTLVVDATVPFDVVAEQVGGGSTVTRAGASQASVTRSVEVLGRRLRVVATGAVEVVDGRLVVEPTSVDVGGPDVLSGALAAAARRLVTISHDVEGLPDGLVLLDVAVTDTGFRAHLDGTDVELGP